VQDFKETPQKDLESVSRRAFYDYLSVFGSQSMSGIRYVDGMEGYNFFFGGFINIQNLSRSREMEVQGGQSMV
jgi:hypothetical protein